MNYEKLSGAFLYVRPDSFFYNYQRGECPVKLIHCADLHLDSAMTTHLSKEKAQERKAELLRTFERMVEYARENEVEAILIAGDLFDRKNVSATARKSVRQAI